MEWDGVGWSGMEWDGTDGTRRVAIGEREEVLETGVAQQQHQVEGIGDGTEVERKEDELACVKCSTPLAI